MKKRFLQIADWRKVLLLGMAFLYGNVAMSNTLTLVNLAGGKGYEIKITPSYYQLITIKGKVTDELGMPIPGATVLHKETGVTTATNGNGDYNINVPQASGTLIFSVVGYQTKEVALRSNTVINISMEAVSGNLNEIVVVGYGTQKKATVTGSVVAVKGSEIVKSPSINVANSLAGRLPGVIVNNRSGEPGRDNPSISIRGRSTTGNSSALVIIDGVERSGLGQINPNDIESISVLKDASAAIYGARAANGVILVTSKRGSANAAPTVNLSFNQGFTGPTRNPGMADSYTFFNVYNEIEEGEGRPAKYSSEELEKFKAGTDPNYANFNWYDFIVKKWTPQHRTDLSVTGGSNSTKYFLSFGEVMQDGQYKFGSTKVKQYNLRSNVDVQVTDNFKVGMNLAARFDDNHFPYRSMNELNSHIYLYQPNWVPYWPGTDFITPNRANDNIINFVSDDNGYQNVKTTTIQTTVFANWTLPWVKGLSLSGSGSYDPNTQFRKTWQLPTYVYYKNTADDGYTRARSGFGVNNADLLDRTDMGSLFYLTGRLNYDRKFGKHNFAGLLGYEQQTTKSNYVAAYRSDFVSTVLPEIFAGSSDKAKQGNDGSAGQGARKNYFGRITYDYASKYLAEFTMRRDGSPNFPSAKRWGNFPSASIGYRISEETFLKKHNFINDLKIRASYGVLGNDLVNAFQYLQTYGYGNNFVIGNNDVTGLVQMGVPNPNITWETAKTGNIGLDANLWNGKLGITFDYFKTRRADILTKRSAIIPGYTGLVLPDENIGIVDNKGFELVLSHANNDHEFKYDFSGNVAFARNKVVFSDEQPAAEQYQLATGRPIGAGLYYNAIGVFNDDAEVAAYPHFVNARPGDLKYEDVNMDGELNSRDQIRVNQTNVPEITFGFSANFRYKGFDLSVLLQGQENAKSYFGGYFPVMSYSLGNFLSWRAEDRWTPQNTNATMPRASYDLFNDNTTNSTQWLLNAGFLKLRNVELGYNLPKDLLAKVKVKNVRVSVSGSNLLIIYDHMKNLGFDPETTDYWYYPPQRVVNFGINVTL
ncbi:TonB-linked SusC/RagA family outer membrane protein [Pedobacter sp. CAN_A7]|uniref:SusC/RagA family TonB-linked outer membrane protein n=1 Tax=Pedobacter sp. CAN_A7 TaxID=2787722 RepID=UPI0018CB9091